MALTSAGAVLLMLVSSLLGFSATAQAATAGSGPVATAVFTTAGTTNGVDTGWAQLAAGGKVWVSATCRSQLVAASVPLRVMDWSAIQGTPDAPAVDCAKLVPAPVQAAGGPVATAVLTTAGTTNGVDTGWAQLAAGGKVWVSATCRSQLVAASVPLRVMDWSAIQGTPDAPAVDCAKLVPAPVQAAGGPVATAVLTTAGTTNGVDTGWAQLAAGGKVWVSATCRSQLVAASVPLRVMDWSAIQGTPDAPAVDCAKLVPETVPLGMVEGVSRQVCKPRVDQDRPL